jgi:hypothetical protein
MTDHAVHDDTDLGIRIRSLKERIYATFTGLAILAALAAAGHADAWDAFLTVLVGVFGISAAGFLAEIVAHQVGHQRLPSPGEVGTMAKIALTALGSASAPLVVLALSGIGLFGVELALRISMGVYAATLVIIFLIASRQSGLKVLQRIVSSAMFVGLALLVVAVLLVAHLH